MFVGRTDDAEAQAEALRLLRVPTDVGYEEMLGTLSPRPTATRSLGEHDDRPDDTPRQFVFSDGHGGVEKIRVDLEGPHLTHLREALDTNPDARRAHLPVRSAAPHRPRGARAGRRGARPRPRVRAPRPAAVPTGADASEDDGVPAAARTGQGRRRRVIVVVGIVVAALVHRLAARGSASEPWQQWHVPAI